MIIVKVKKNILRNHNFMNRKRFFVLFLLFLLLVVNNMAYADISNDKMSIGEIKIGDNSQKVIKIFGEPKSIIKKIQYNSDTNKDYEFKNLYYNDTFEVYCADDIVTRVILSGENGITTFDGIKIGDSKEQMIKKYGKKYAEIPEDGPQTEDTEIVYIYDGEKLSNGERTHLYFTIKRNIIKHIEMYNW